MTRNAAAMRAGENKSHSRTGYPEISRLAASVMMPPNRMVCA